MMQFDLSETEKTGVIKTLIEKSSPRPDFFIMVLLSVSMATFGFLLSSEATIIGSMLIAPLLFPILSLSAGLVMSEKFLISNALSTIAKSLLLSVLVATILTFLFGNQVPINEVMTSRFAPSYLFLFVAIIAGFAASYAMIKPTLNELLPGVAISVTLIPPLAIMGIGIAKWNWVVFSDALIVFLMNLIGIIVANMIIFAFLNLYTKRNTAKELVKKDVKEIEKETNGN